MKSGIYHILNTQNNERYIGSSVNVFKRFREHRNALRKNRHPNNKLQNAWNKYREESFKFELLWNVEPYKESLLLEEQYCFNYLNCEYNLSPYASSNLGIKFTKEHKDKLALSKLGKRNPNYKDPCLRTRQKANPMLTYIKRSTAGKLGLGRRRSETTKQKIALSKLGKQNPRAKPIEAICSKTGLVKEYESISSTKIDGFNPGCVLLCLQGRQESHREYYWNILDCSKVE